MRRLVTTTAVLAVLAGGSVAASAAPLPLPAATGLPAAAGLRAGVGVVDATWHVGAGAGQYASTQDVSDPLRSEWDPNLQHVKNASSYGVASRLIDAGPRAAEPGQAARRAGQERQLPRRRTC